MEFLQYKGYTASVEVDLEAGILYGRVLYLRDGIDFQAERVKDLQKEFENSVEDYLSWCREDGREPDKPFSGKFVTRLDPSLHREAAVCAAREGISLNEWVKSAVDEKIRRAVQVPKQLLTVCGRSDKFIPQLQQVDTDWSASLELSNSQDRATDGNILSDPKASKESAHTDRG